MGNEIEWRDIPGYEGLYEISEYGDVRRMVNRHQYKAGELLSHKISRYGYHRVSIQVQHAIGQYMIHRLVALAFIGPCPEGCEVNHKDLDKSNNHYSNLEYVTHLENVRHSRVTKTDWRSYRGEMNPNNKLSEGDVIQIRNLDSQGINWDEIATTFNISKMSVYRIVRRKTWAWLF